MGARRRLRRGGGAGGVWWWTWVTLLVWVLWVANKYSIDSIAYGGGDVEGWVGACGEPHSWRAALEEPTLWRSQNISPQTPSLGGKGEKGVLRVADGFLFLVRVGESDMGFLLVGGR